MRNLAEDTFLLSMLVKDKMQFDDLKMQLSDPANDGVSTLDILKDRGYVTIGILEDDAEICIEPGDPEKIDRLLYEYISYKKFEWYNGLSRKA